MLPHRCLLSWLGWQLHANDARKLGWRGPGGGPTGALGEGLVGWPGKGLAGCPARVLLWRAVVPDKDLAGGLVAFLGKDPAEGCRLLVLILISYIYGLDKDLHATTEVPPEPRSNRSWLGWNLWAQGRLALLVWGELSW